MVVDMAKKKKKQTESEEPRVVGRLGASGEIAPFESARVLGRVDEQGNRIAYIQKQKEDIAPVKKKSTWFKNGMDDSGYAYTGTLDKINRFNASVLMTGVDILGNIGLGITKPVEGVGDFVQNRTADVLDFFGGDKAAEKVRKSAEKDWWVTAILYALFHTKVADYLLFKGGTSLSKGWNIIDRFSGDIDLALSRDFFFN